MNKNVFLVDDSPFMRKIMVDVLEKIDGLNIIGTARNGRDALKQLMVLKPDLVLMDVQMPGLNGLDTLELIKEKYDFPVMMMSANSNQGMTIEALERGAIDFIEKPKDLINHSDTFRIEVTEKIKAVEEKSTAPKEKQPIKQSMPHNSPIKRPDALVIGASTGGPKALLAIIRQLPKKVSIPIFIVQHMPAGFTASFAERLDSETTAKVVEAKAGMPIKKGIIYVAPGDFHMAIAKNEVILNEGAKQHGVRPAVDVLFESAAVRYGTNLLGIIFTGMGQDGTKGSICIKENGGSVWVQDEETSVVYGMPGNAVKKGAVDQIASLSDLSEMINGIVG
ncbi:MAG: chemotaxis-specific protein-glutamate methyltransferase CheB [Pisciglobus halotolerans]|nr:chemotaxis-specific protein-glutamate methyltransferase CheB [Pisciglobus halotolerans]